MMTGAPPPPSAGRTAAKGMAWTALALVVSKFLSFFSQIVLGYLLAVETYAIFALLTTAMIFVNGFQNSGVGKVLIQQHDRLEDLLPTHSAFTLWLGVIGLAVFLGVGLVFEAVYQVEPLFWVIAVAAIGIPLKAVSTIHVTVLSVHLDFRRISLLEVQRSVFYYTVLIGAAALGAAGFTMAIALSAAALFHLWLLARATPGTRMSWRLGLRDFGALAVRLRWVIGSAFLFALGMNGDYLVLGGMLSAEDLGYYFFGFALVANLTVMISMGINQALLPLFSRLKDDLGQLRRQFLRIGGALTVMMCILCLGLVGLGPALMHLVWGGKWDPAIVVVVAIAAVLPIRMTATLAGTVFESQGAWGLRLATLIWDAAFILLCAWAGATLGGMTGAAIAVALQRALSGFLTFPLAGWMIGLGPGRTAAFYLRCHGAYVALVAALLLIDPMRHVNLQESTELLRPMLETGGVLLLFLALNWVFNRDILSAMIGLARRRAA